MKLNYGNKDIKEVLKRSLKAKGIDGKREHDVSHLALELVTKFFLQLEEEMLNNDVVFMFPKKLNYLFLCQHNQQAKDPLFSLENRQRRIKLYSQFICKKSRRIPYGKFYGKIAKPFQKKIMKALSQGRTFIRHEDYIEFIKTQLRHGEQLKISDSRSDRFRTRSNSQK